MERLRVIDSHTGGEPTRVVVEGLPDFGSGPIADRLQVIARDFDRYRTAIIGEPRSSPVAVGAYLLPSVCANYGAIFFNNARYLGMCGHGTIGVVTTLACLGKIEPGCLTFETPAGIVRTELSQRGSVSVDNVPAWRLAKEVRVDLGEAGEVVGDIAYGGNWFFISSDHGQEIHPSRLEELDAYTLRVQQALLAQGIADVDGGEIDHIELIGPSQSADARNYVRCPGGEYDRSPCGTGTSAKLACLFEDGKLKEGQVFRVESIIGSVFEGSIRRNGDALIPTITGRAYVNGDTTVLLDPEDPFVWGTP
jgi:4-hydroxyproline epimerase